MKILKSSPQKSAHNDSSTIIASSNSSPESSIVKDIQRKSARKMVELPGFVASATKEATILSRIRELQQEGKWNPKKIPKLNMPPKPKLHWDFVVEEMNWLSSVFLQERKSKKVRFFCFKKYISND